MSISWWNTELHPGGGDAVKKAFEEKKISQGQLCTEFEQCLAERMGVRNVIATSSGTAALFLAMKAAGLGSGDEVIIPNRTWIATAHAVKLCGAQVVCADVRKDIPVIDISDVEKLITKRTKAVIPVHMGGRSCDITRLVDLADTRNILVIEDAAQALFSMHRGQFLGTFGLAGCFSFSMAKLLASGQGGAVVTDDDALAVELRALRTHGLESTLFPENWPKWGFNFRFTDLQSAIALNELKYIDEKIERLLILYQSYEKISQERGIDLIPVDTEIGNIPLYIEVLVDNRLELIKRLEIENIETRPFYPDIGKATYLGLQSISGTNSACFEKQGLYLPSGPGQADQIPDIVTAEIQKIGKSYEF